MFILWREGRSDQSNTSTSCMDTTSTPLLEPLSTHSAPNESMTMTVLRTDVWPFSHICRSVSALF